MLSDYMVRMLSYKDVFNAVLNSEDLDGNNVLMLSVQEGNHFNTNTLLDSPFCTQDILSHRNKHGDTALSLLVRFNNITIASKLISNEDVRTILAIPGDRTLYEAVSQEKPNLNFISRLLSIKDVDPAGNDYEAFRHAVVETKKEVVALFATSMRTGLSEKKLTHIFFSEPFRWKNLNNFHLLEITDYSERCLSLRERSLLFSLREMYGEANVSTYTTISKLREWLADKYNQNPSTVSGLILPIRDDYLNKNPEVRIAYLSNKFHSSWRYMLDDNPWRYVSKFIGISFYPQCEISMKNNLNFIDMEFLALCFLAVTDTKHNIDDVVYCQKELEESFIEQLALMNRAKNSSDHNFEYEGDIPEYNNLFHMFVDALSEGGHPLFNAPMHRPITRNRVFKIFGLNVLSHIRSKTTDEKIKIKLALKHYSCDAASLPKKEIKILSTLERELYILKLETAPKCRQEFGLNNLVDETLAGERNKLDNYIDGIIRPGEKLFSTIDMFSSYLYGGLSDANIQQGPILTWYNLQAHNKVASCRGYRAKRRLKAKLQI